jgi:hypothetical protein
MQYDADGGAHERILSQLFDAVPTTSQTTEIDGTTSQTTEIDGTTSQTTEIDGTTRHVTPGALIPKGTLVAVPLGAVRVIVGIGPTPKKAEGAVAAPIVENVRRGPTDRGPRVGAPVTEP